MTIRNFLNYEKRALYLSRNTLHLAEDSSEKGALPTTDGTYDCGQATLLDGHVDIMDECLGFFGTLIGSRNMSVLLLDPLERSAGYTDRIGIDRVGVKRNWGSFGSHQEGVDAAPGRGCDCTRTKWQTEYITEKTNV